MTPIWSATGSTQVTPTEEYFRDTNAGGFVIDANGNRAGQASLIQRNPDGTTDMVRMNSGDGVWYASKNRAQDVRAGRL